MIILITGASHTGKTLVAQKLLENYQYPILSIDLLKMGLIRSGNTSLTPEDDEQLEKYLWPIIREMIKTAIENIKNYADVIEKRLDDTWFTKEMALNENLQNLEQCKKMIVLIF